MCVVGSRNFDMLDLFIVEIEKILKEYDIDTIISGGAKGADSFARRYAKRYKFKYKEFEAEWDTYGKSAGMIRNKDIVENSDIALIFWDGISKGTKNSFDLIKAKGIPYHLVLFELDLPEKENIMGEWE